MISIIIPACNEEAVIGRGLRAILKGVQPGEIEVIVACNGCTDRTADVCRQFGPAVRVLEIEAASKIAALNTAEEAAIGFPRVYVDADIVLPLAGIRAMAALLSDRAVLMATPALRVDVVRSSWFVRAYYRVWMALPYNQADGAAIAGAYALSREGRRRFGRFPDVIADDGFVWMLFGSDERASSRDAIALKVAPRSMAGLIRIHTRARLGGLELQMRYPAHMVRNRKPILPLIWFVAKRYDLWLYVPVYVAMTMFIRWRARNQFRKGQRNWERDDSSRGP